MSIGYVGEAYPLVGGWFGPQGISITDDFVMVDGWFGEVPCNCDDLFVRLCLVEDALRSNEPIFIGADGHLYEINVPEKSVDPGLPPLPGPPH